MFSHVKIYAAWETDEIIGYELIRNIGLALVAVAVVTLILLTNLQEKKTIFLSLSASCLGCGWFESRPSKDIERCAMSDMLH